MTYENRTDEGAFLPSIIDDFGLTPIQFRVYYRIKRRAGSGQCWESAASMAKGCLMDVKSVRKAIRELALMNLISIQTRKGKSPLIALNPASMWQPLPKIHPTQNPPYPKSTQVQNGQGVGCETDRVPYPKSTHEDISNKTTNEERNFLGEQKKSNTSEADFDGLADARNTQALPSGVSQKDTGLTTEEELSLVEKEENRQRQESTVSPAQSVKSTSKASQRVASKKVQVRELIGTRTKDVAGFLKWRGEQLAATDFYRDTNVTEDVVLHFYAKKLKGFSDQEKAEALQEVTEAIEADLQRWPHRNRQQVRATREELFDQIAALHETDPMAAMELGHKHHIWNAFYRERLRKHA